MATFIYVPDYVMTGWFEDDGARLLSWFNRDLTEDNLIHLNIFEPSFFDDPDTIFPLQGPGTPIPPPWPPGVPPLAGITVGLVAGFFDDDDLFFVPMNVRALVPVDKMLKNEVRRIR